MGALSYFLERAGLLTTGISLVRENTASMQPPRALWTSFRLGRPLGKPGDPGFQHRVIGAALGLLEREAGPVLEDFPEDLPELDEESVMACPVSFPRQADADAGWEAKLVAEVDRLMPWHDLARRRRGRSLVGVADAPPAENARSLGRLLDEQQQPQDIRWLKHAVEDLKIFYLEAMTAQPGEYDAAALQQMFWQETTLGAAVLQLHEVYQSSPDPRQQMIARMLAPREAVGGHTGPGPSGSNHEEKQ